MSTTDVRRPFSISVAGEHVVAQEKWALITRFISTALTGGEASRDTVRITLLEDLDVPARTMPETKSIAIRLDVAFDSTRVIRTVRHELVHLDLMEQDPSWRYVLPWVQEGLATLAEGPPNCREHAQMFLRVKLGKRSEVPGPKLEGSGRAPTRDQQLLAYYLVSHLLQEGLDESELTSLGRWPLHGDQPMDPVAIFPGLNVYSEWWNGFQADVESGVVFDRLREVCVEFTSQVQH